MGDERVNHSSNKVRVWDAPVRIFHWALVALMVSQIVTANIGGNAMDYHMLGGYSILALVLFRIVWGVVGARHARFNDFVRGPGAVLRYARSLATERHERHLGHNPLGGWSVLLMLASLLVQAGSGLFADDEIMTTGPLAKHVSNDTVSLLTTIHDVNAFVLFVLVGVHIAAVLFHLLARQENLVRPMITGKKDWHTGDADAVAPGAGIWRALLVLICCGALTYAIVSL